MSDLTSEPTDFELRVLREIAQGAVIAGNKLIAVSAAARRLEKKGLAMQGRRWYATEAGRKKLEELKGEE